MFIGIYVFIRVLRVFFEVYRIKKNITKTFDTFNNFHTKNAQTKEGVMLKCVTCNAYVAEELSVSYQNRGERIFFCSEECKNDFIQGSR